MPAETQPREILNLKFGAMFSALLKDKHTMQHQSPTVLHCTFCGSVIKHKIQKTSCSLPSNAMNATETSKRNHLSNVLSDDEAQRPRKVSRMDMCRPEDNLTDHETEADRLESQSASDAEFKEEEEEEEGTLAHTAMLRLQEVKHGLTLDNLDEAIMLLEDIQPQVDSVRVRSLKRLLEEMIRTENAHQESCIHMMGKVSRETCDLLNQVKVATLIEIKSDIMERIKDDEFSSNVD